MSLKSGAKEKVEGRTTALVFNASVAAACVAAASELRVFTVLERDGSLSVGEFCDAHGLHRSSFESVLLMLAGFDIVNFEGGAKSATRGPAFDEFYREGGTFEWLFRGTGNLLNDLGDYLKVENRPPEPMKSNLLRRDGAKVARASSACGRFVDPYVGEFIDALSFEKVLDLGCGAAARLIDVVERRGCLGVGVDVSAEAVEYARQAVRARGLESRITIIHADVAALDVRPALADVDLMTMFFMGHDLWPAEDCGRVLRRLRRAAPNCRRFLLCDTVLSQSPPSPYAPAFTSGFELAHTIMEKKVPTLDQWLDLFQASDWACADYHPIGMPYSYIFDLTSKA